MNAKFQRGKLFNETLQNLIDESNSNCEYEVFAWCIEMFQTVALILDDIIDNSITRRFNLCWFRKV